MASVIVKMPDEFLQKLSRLGEQTDRIAEEVLKAGAKVVEDKVRSNLTNVIGRNTKSKSRSTGQLLAALGTSKVRVDRNGNSDIKVGFAESRHDGKSNAQIANILEYGKHGQPAKPFLKPAKSASKSACEAAMKAAFEAEVNKL